MSGIVRQEEPNMMAQQQAAVSDSDVASLDEVFHWDGNVLRIDVSDLQCESLMINDLNQDLALAMQSTAHV